MSDLRPNIWVSSEEVTPNFFLRVSVSIGMFRAVTSALGKDVDASLILFLSKGYDSIILNTLPSPFSVSDLNSASDII